MKNNPKLPRRTFVRNTSLLLGGLFTGFTSLANETKAENLFIYLEGGVRKSDLENILEKTGLLEKLHLKKIVCNADSLCHIEAARQLFSNPTAEKTPISNHLHQQGFKQIKNNLYAKDLFQIQIISGFDCAHYNDTAYFTLLEKSVVELNKIIESKKFKHIICCSEFGRNQHCGNHDGFSDGYIHHQDESARETFLLSYTKNSRSPYLAEDIHYTSEVKLLINRLNGRDIFSSCL